MSGPQVFHSSDRYGKASGRNNEDCPEITKKTINESFLELARCMEEAEIHVSTSRNYIKAAKNSIDNLKNCLANADADINTTEECILESDARLQRLRAELQSLFNRTFYLNLDTDSDETTARKGRHTRSNVVSVDEFSVPDHVSQALQKYAKETKINLENYKTTFDRCYGLMFIVMHRKGTESTLVDDSGSDAQRSAFPQRNETSDSTMRSIFTKGGTSPHSQREFSLRTRNFDTDNLLGMTINRGKPSHQVENLLVFPKERSQGQNIGEIINKTERCPSTLVKNPKESCTGSRQTTRGFLQPRNNLARECTRIANSDEFSSFRLHQSDERKSPKIVNKYEHQSEGILVKIDSSDSENENEVFKKSEVTRPPVTYESNDLIKMSSSSCDSETIKLSVEESDNENSSNIRRKLHRINNTESSKADIPHSSYTFQCEKYGAPFTRSNFPKSAEHSRKKTYSLSSINKGTKHTSDHGKQERHDDSSDPITQKYGMVRDEEKFVCSSGLLCTSNKTNINRQDKTGCLSKKKEKNRFDQLEVASPKGLGGRCYSDHLYPKKTVDDSDMKCFRTPQYKNRRHTLTNETLSKTLNRTFHLGNYQKQPENPRCSSKKAANSEKWDNFLRCSAKNSFSADENSPTCRATRDISESGDNRSRDRSREFSESPSCVSFPDEVFRYKHELELSDFDTASASTAIHMCFDSETETSSHTDDAASNAVDMSFDSPTELSFSVATYNESLSSLNADTSGSVYVLISEESTNSRSPTPDKETFSTINDFPRASQRAQYESLTSRDSAESFLTVYESSADIDRFQSDEFSFPDIIPEQRNLTLSSSFIDSSHQRNAVSFTYSNQKLFMPKYPSHSSESEYSP